MGTSMKRATAPSAAATFSASKLLAACAAVTYR
jgi:hypothetical protein